MKIKKVKWLKGTVLEIVDDEHVHYLLNVAHWTKLPILNFKELLSYSYISKVRTAENGNTIEWPNGQEIAPEDVEDFAVPACCATGLYDFNEEADVSKEHIRRNETVVVDGVELSITLGWTESEYGDLIWLVTLGNSVWVETADQEHACVLYELLHDHIHEYTTRSLVWEKISDE